ncbi:3-keto-disaccharide hydrolase [Altererythrobacter sp. C41]|uniref:3-keto-disaccharide hydrolase n=1 Tax=Altererythrobacter sp. C41 TaxID=2806021 RepID=UPI003083E4F2
MRRINLAAVIAVATLAGGAAMAQDKPGFRDTPTLPGGEWKVHDADRPHPEVVTPGATPGAPPSDAVVLFDGTSLDAWEPTGQPWQLENGVLTVPAREEGEEASTLVSKQSFGDVQLHLEFRSPSPPQKSSQDRGNSGVWFMERYEVQILDGYDNPTYADGTVGAIYGWKPPLVNASRKPGEWQSYDIVFERPRFAADGSVERPAYVTVFLNGVLVQNRQPFLGSTIWRDVGKYEAHADAAPIQLQDHDSPVSFRNIWVRPLPEAALSHDAMGDHQ